MRNRLAKSLDVRRVAYEVVYIFELLTVKLAHRRADGVDRNESKLRGAAKAGRRNSKD